MLQSGQKNISKPLRLSSSLLPGQYDAISQRLYDPRLPCEYGPPTIVAQIRMIEMCHQYILSDLIVMGKICPKAICER
jgi:hypothetical protein